MSAEPHNEAREALVRRLMRIQKLARAAFAWQMAGCPIKDPHDTYPNELYDASVMASNMVQLIDEVFAALATPLEGAGDGGVPVSVSSGSGVSGEACGHSPVRLTTERHIALREAHMISGEDAYFAARPDRDVAPHRLMWRHGFERGFNAAAEVYQQVAESISAPDTDEVLIAIKRPEDYGDVHPQLVAEDAFETPAAFEWRVVQPAPPLEAPAIPAQAGQDEREPLPMSETALRAVVDRYFQNGQRDSDFALDLPLYRAIEAAAMSAQKGGAA